MFSLYTTYSHKEIMRRFSEKGIPDIFCEGDFAILDGVVLVFITNGDPLTQSCVARPSACTWRPRQPVTDRRVGGDFSWFPRPIREGKAFHVFAKTPTDTLWSYLDTAHLGSYGFAGTDCRANFPLFEKLPRDVWLRVGGSLLPQQPFKHLLDVTRPKVKLLFHQRAFELLHLPPQQDEAALHQLKEMEQKYAIQFPAAVREWYSLVGITEIMREFSACNWPIDTLDRIRQYLEDDELKEHYNRTAPYRDMLPLMFENQWCWHLAMPLIGDDPPVYWGEPDDTSFTWSLHAERFSEFIEAWVWDYTAAARDYCLILHTPLPLTDDDITAIRHTFQKGPTTYWVRPWLRIACLERYFHHDQRITLWTDTTLPDETYAAAEFIATTADSLKTLLRGPWSHGDLLERLGDIDLEMQKLWLW